MNEQTIQQTDFAKQWITKQEAIDALDIGCELLRRALDDTDVVGVERAKYEWGLGLIESYIADIKELPPEQPKKVFVAEIKIDGDEMQKCVDKAVNRILYDAYQPLTEEDYAALRERFGVEAEKTVREMAEGNANRWMI